MSPSLWDKALAVYRGHREQFSYLFFGGLTTLVNFAAIFICVEFIGIQEDVSNVIAWVAAVSFAYVTNKLVVFESRTSGKAAFMRELLSFFGGRVLTFAVEQGLFMLGTNVLGIHYLIVKIPTQIIVIVSNYVLSKLIVFRKSKSNSKEAAK